MPLQLTFTIFIIAMKEYMHTLGHLVVLGGFSKKSTSIEQNQP